MQASRHRCIVGFDASGFEWLTSMIMCVLFVGDSLFQNLFVLVPVILNFGSQAQKGFILSHFQRVCTK